MRVGGIRHTRLPSGVRAHATVAAAVIVGVASLLGGAALLLPLQNCLTSTQLDAVSALVDEDANVFAIAGLGTGAERDGSRT